MSVMKPYQEKHCDETNFQTSYDSTLVNVRGETVSQEMCYDKPFFKLLTTVQFLGLCII